MNAMQHLDLELSQKSSLKILIQRLDSNSNIPRDQEIPENTGERVAQQ